MGLDLYVMKVKKNEDIYSKNYDWDANEICYGRKAWEICSEFGAASEPECQVKITLDSWAEFIDKLAPIGEYLDDIWDAYHKWYNCSDEDEKFVMTDRDRQLIATYETWYRQAFDRITPTLGYEFSVGYMLSFWKAAEEVFRLLEDDEYDVYMVASY